MGLRNATNMGLREKNDAIDRMVVEIDNFRQIQLSIIYDWETKISKILSEVYRRPVIIKFGEVTQRAKSGAGVGDRSYYKEPLSPSQ